MKLRKMMVILLALCMALFTIGCGSSGGSDDDEEDTATWPVEYYMSVGGSPAPLMKAAPQTGTYKYLYFNKNNTYESGDLNNGTLTKTGEGSYSGGDPHNNVTLSLTGTFEGSTLNGESVAISSGSLTIAGKTFAKDGSNSTDPTPTPVVTWPVIYRAENPEAPGTYFYIVFKEDGTFVASEGTVEHAMGGGTYSGADPHGDGTVTMSGNMGETPIPEGNYVIADGVLSLFLNWERQ